MTMLNRTCVSPYQYSIETTCLYLVLFFRYSASKNGVTLKPGQGLFKVIKNGADRQTLYHFLLVRHCKYSSILYRFCRAMLCKRGLCRHAVSVCLSVRSSVTFVSCVKTNKHIIKKILPSVATPFQFFRAKRHSNIPTGTPLKGASNAGGVG